jgi:hypothetical protein
MASSHTPARRANGDGERRSSPGRADFANALDACRAVLAEALPSDGDGLGALSRDGIRDAVFVLARNASAQRVPPERVLAVFKEMVARLPNVAHRSSHTRGAIVSQLTHVMIDAYYRRDGDGNALLRNEGPSF